MKPTTTNTIEAIGPDETMLHLVHKSIFGLFLVYAQVAVGFVAAALLIIFLAPVALPKADPVTLRSDVAVIIGAGAIMTWLILVLFTYIYRQSKLIITNKNLTQIIQHGLFVRQVSELSMADVEDVSAAKKGIFATIFDYGDLLVETAGETDNFRFSFCPKPDIYGKIVLDAREKFIHDQTE